MNKIGNGHKVYVLFGIQLIAYNVSYRNGILANEVCLAPYPFKYIRKYAEFTFSI